MRSPITIDGTEAVLAPIGSAEHADAFVLGATLDTAIDRRPASMGLDLSKLDFIGGPAWWPWQIPRSGRFKWERPPPRRRWAGGNREKSDWPSRSSEDHRAFDIRPQLAHAGQRQCVTLWA